MPDAPPEFLDFFERRLAENERRTAAMPGQYQHDRPKPTTTPQVAAAAQETIQDSTELPLTQINLDDISAEVAEEMASTALNDYVIFG